MDAYLVGKSIIESMKLSMWLIVMAESDQDQEDAQGELSWLCIIYSGYTYIYFYYNLLNCMFMFNHWIYTHVTDFFLKFKE